MNIYLDIDGVVLTKEGKPANHLKAFLKYITTAYDVYWLTTHCKGDAQYTLDYLSRFLEPDIIELLKSVKATNWQTNKTEAIDFDSEFLWFDDFLFPLEIDQLESHEKIDSWIKVDLKSNPSQLNIIYNSIKNNTNYAK